MSICEKCWSDAGVRAKEFGGSLLDRYDELMKERKSNPCSLEEQGFHRVCGGWAKTERGYEDPEGMRR